MPDMPSVVFVCLGNICRSPTAEGIFADLIAKNDLSESFSTDSAGTGGWHVGQAADPRSREEARRRGIELTSRSRQFQREDFAQFDVIIAMDQSNLRNILRLAQTDDERTRVHLLRDFDSTAAPGSDVPDPYYGGSRGFPDVFDICERGCNGLLEYLRNQPKTKQ